MPALPPTFRVRAAATDHVEPTGTPVVDGVQTAAGDEVLLCGQADPARNGPYLVPAVTGPWGRHPNYDTDAEFVPDMDFKVAEGTTNRGARFYFANPTPPTLGLTLLNFLKEAHTEAPSGGDGVTVDPATGVLGLADVLPLPGTVTNPTVEYDEKGRAVNVSAGSVPTTSIEGLEVVFVNSTALDIFPGSLWIPGLNRVLDFPSKIRKSGLAFTAGAWHYLYAFEDAGVPNIEVSTDAPTAPYRGGARTKGGTTPDTSRRLIGAVYATSTSAMRRFQVLSGGFVRWVANLNDDLRAGSALTNTTGADLSVGAFAPPFSSGVEVALTLGNTDNPSTFYVTAVGDGLMTAGGSENAGQTNVGTVTTSPRNQTSGPIAFAGTTTLRHRQTGAGASRFGHIDIAGYYQELS